MCVQNARAGALAAAPLAKFLGKGQHGRKELFDHLHQVLPLELNYLDEGQRDDLELDALQLSPDSMGGVEHERLHGVALGLLQRRERFAKGVVGLQHGGEYVFFAGEVVVDSAQGQVGVLCNIAHAGPVVALLQEE